MPYYYCYYYYYYYYYYYFDNGRDCKAPRVRLRAICEFGIFSLHCYYRLSDNNPYELSPLPEYEPGSFRRQTHEMLRL